MSTDKYPRVVRYVNGRWTVTSDGTHKVVPADAIVIERGGTVMGSITAEKAREIGVRYLALAEHLRANPPVDEAEVDRLADLLVNDLPLRSLRDRARRLYLAGVRAPEVTP